MNIEQKKQQEDKFLIGIYPIAKDKIIWKTNAELEMQSYRLHFYYIRFIFALLSFALYIPTLIELFQNSFVLADYIRNFIILLILLLLEIGLSFSLYDYYTRKHSDNTNRRKIIIYSLAFVSIILSALSGVNAIDLVDNSENNIIAETRINQANEVDKYLKHITINNSKITDINKTFVINNENIKSLAPIAATTRGNAQIEKFQKQNDRIQTFIATLINQNNHLYKIIDNIRYENKNLMKARITKAGKKELIYMIIFFCAGIIAVLGLMYSYNFIGQYYKYIKDDARNIEVLKRELETTEREEKKERLRKQIEEKELEMQLKSMDSSNNNREIIFNIPEKKKFF